VFPHPLGWSLLLAIPAFLLLMLNGGWIAILSGILATRFRDIPPIIASVVQLVFYMTPIVWSVDILSANAAVAERARLVELNPVFHFVEILRRPLLGEPTIWRFWAVVGVITVVGWIVGMLCLRNYRARVAYWV
jgi:ABC-2 type transport system permease protein